MRVKNRSNFMTHDEIEKAFADYKTSHRAEIAKRLKKQEKRDAIVMPAYYKIYAATVLVVLYCWYWLLII